jgi:hypothetical protein
VRRGDLAKHARGWLVKVFFLPLMITYLHGSLPRIVDFDFSGASWDNLRLYDFLYDGAFLVDLAFATVGYAYSLRAADTHVRSAEPTMFGWVIALLCYQPFFSGISLDVTPQIDENDNITLHVHSMVNSINEKEKIALPAANATRVPFAVNSISETDSVVKTRDSQVVVIGGLMTETMSDNRSKIPGAGDVPVIGSLFGKAARNTVKRELVILLKPTVVKGDDAWAGDINAAQGRIERMNSAAPSVSRVQ